MHAQSCLTLLWPHGLQPARLLCPWDFPGKNTVVAISTSRGSSRPRDWTRVSCVAGRLFTIWATRGFTYRCIHIFKLIKLFMLNMYSFVYFNHTSINWFFFLKKKVTYWDILSPRAGQLLFLSISPKVCVGHAGLFCPNVVHSHLWAHSQLSEGDLGRAFCSLWAAGSRLPTGTCLPAVVVQLLSLCGHVSDFVSNSFPSAYRNVSTSDTGSHDNPGPQFARHLLHGSIVPIHREPIP